MRKILVTTALVGFLLALSAPAIAAVRDPFQAPISTTAGATTTIAGQPDTAGSVPFTPSTEAQPNTGFDASSWLGVAYALIAAGVGSLVLARELQPRTTR
jgi:hypothetical protein